MKWDALRSGPNFFRHAYAYILEWEEMQDLVGRLRNIWETTKQEIEAFLETEGEEPDHTTHQTS